MRAEMLARIRESRVWDVVVIGGGATGLGTALDAASRGYQTLLLEAEDFAKGTSSRSTKLIHGGVRYLARGEIGLVREALRERSLLLQNAPHLVHDRAFLVPAYSYWDLAKYGAGLKAYDLLGAGHGFGPSRWLSRTDAMATVSTLKSAGLRGGILYHDGQFDDSRLAVSLMLTLLDQGGTALNYAPVVDLIKSGGRVTGVTARDSETGEALSITARSVVNACGVYVDALRRIDDARAPQLLRPSRGVHIVLDRAFLPNDAALMVPRTDDGRVLFLIPWHDRVLVGTTDVAVNEATIEPHASKEEVTSLLEDSARYLTRAPRAEDIRSVFSGLRPLLEQKARGSTARLSREHAVLVSPSGLVTVTGGKWTTYRRMAADTVDRAVEVGGLTRAPCITETLRLHGAIPSDPTSPLAWYGSEATHVQELIASKPEWAEPVHPSLSTRCGEVVWAVRHEMARHVEDVLARRSRALFLDARASIDAAPRVADLMAEELGFDQTWRQSEVDQFRELARHYLPQ
ncbi:MAG: glpD [Planctomycetota bacterium]|nr:glpD [Planctomycetota bacterium]